MLNVGLTDDKCVCMCVWQVAGRLHVEVWRGTESSEADGPGQCDTQQNVADRDPQERRLDCVVRKKQTQLHSSVYRVI